MTRSQITKLNMFNAIKNFVDISNPVVIELMPGFGAVRETFNVNLGLIITEHGYQYVNIEGNTVAKTELRNIICKRSSVVSGKMVAYANNSNNMELRDRIKFTNSTLMNMNELNFITASTLVYTTAEELLPDLLEYHVSASELILLLQSLTAYNILRPNLREGVVVRKAATENIVGLMSSNDAYLKLMTDLSLTVVESHPEFVHQFHLTSRIGKTPYRVLAARIIVTDVLGARIEKARVRCKLLRIDRRTSGQGVVQIRNVQDGVYTFIVSKSGMPSVNIEIPVTVGEITVKTVVL